MLVVARELAMNQKLISFWEVTLSQLTHIEGNITYVPVKLDFNNYEVAK